MEKVIKAIVILVSVVVMHFAYRTHDLDCVTKNAWMYRLSYAVIIVMGILTIAVDVLRLF